MTQQTFGRSYRCTAAENYERFFVPAIGAPLAEDLVRRADPRRGERVLDVACGTGVVTRLVAARIGAERVAGLDVNPGMLAVARKAMEQGHVVDWHEASAEAIPIADGAFDVVLCQMGLAFVPDPVRALREMRRVLAPRGRLVLNTPGPIPPMFAVLSDAVRRHVAARAASFVDQVFALHDPQELRRLMDRAGFVEVDVQRTATTLTLPPAAAFLWRYVASTPLAELVEEASVERRAELEADVVERWQDFTVEGALTCDLTISTVIAR